MNQKVIGKSSHVLAYFGALHAIIAAVALFLFILQLVTLEDGIAAIFSREMLYLQFTLLGMLLPSVAFCSYLSLGLKLNSPFYRNALTVSALMLLPIVPFVVLVGFYMLWLSRR
jgi:hypothetical protein